MKIIGRKYTPPKGRHCFSILFVDAKLVVLFVLKEERKQKSLRNSNTTINALITRKRATNEPFENLSAHLSFSYFLI